jgi:hypothetical protein
VSSPCHTEIVLTFKKKQTAPNSEEEVTQKKRTPTIPQITEKIKTWHRNKFSKK